MANSIKGSKPFVLGELGAPTRQIFETWKVRLINHIKLDKDYRQFVGKDYKWKEKDVNENRGLIKEEEATTAIHLDNFINLVASFSPPHLYEDIINLSTSLKWIWEQIRALYHIENDDVTLFEWEDFKMETEEKEYPEMLYRRLRSFMQENLVKADSSVLFKGKAPDKNETLSPTLEKLIVIKWLRCIDPALPKLVKEKFGSELKMKSIVDLQPNISRMIPSLLEQIRGMEAVLEARNIQVNWVKQNRDKNFGSSNSTVRSFGYNQKFSNNKLPTNSNNYQRSYDNRYKDNTNVNRSVPNTNINRLVPKCKNCSPKFESGHKMSECPRLSIHVKEMLGFTVRVTNIDEENCEEIMDEEIDEEPFEKL